MRESVVMRTLEIDGDLLTRFCRRNHIRTLSLFGSALRGELRESSDVDLLVEFEPNHVPGFFGLVRMEEELTEIVGRKVDLRTRGELSRYFRDQVASEARPLYAAN